VTLTASDRESDQLKQKLLTIRAENSQLRTLVSQLRDQLERYSEMVSLLGIKEFGNRCDVNN